MTLPVKLIEELLLATGALLFSVVVVAYSYWKKCQPSEKIEAARKAGRPICHCTVDGTVMLADPKQAEQFHKIYVCPVCKDKTPVQFRAGVWATVV